MTPGEFEAELLRRFPHGHSDKQQGTLWHYTTAAGLKGILTTGNIWATHFAHTNDTEELRFGHELVSRAIAAVSVPPGSVEARIVERVNANWERSTMSPDSPFFIAAFCEGSGNELSQWRGYGEFGAGYSIGFRELPRTPLLKVRYPDPKNVDGEAYQLVVETVRASAALMGDPPDDALLKIAEDHIAFALLLTALRAKNPAFEPEGEWRLVDIEEKKVEYRASERGLIPYIQLSVADPLLVSSIPGAPPRIDLDGIFVGPQQNAPASVAALTDFLRSLGYTDSKTLARSSGIPFRR